MPTVLEVPVKVVAPAKACTQVDGLSGRTYKARDGIYNMSARDGRALVKAGGFIPSLAGATSTSTGFRCLLCGFGSFFRRCSRCGGDCHKEG